VDSIAVQMPEEVDRFSHGKIQGHAIWTYYFKFDLYGLSGRAVANL
jgi:hypothetical protein